MPTGAEPHDGPYLAMAVFCDRVLQENNGVLSLIRVVDRINVSGGGGAPEEMPAIPLQLTAVLSFKSGFAKGKYTITLQPVTPSGKVLSPSKMQALFEGDDRGVNLIVNIALSVSEEGLYWFDLLVEEQLVTRMPLRILYQRTGGGATPNS